MSAAAKILERLNSVKQTGAGRWLARCPAHEDRTPSLSIRETADGMVLLHDFGGCEVGAVLDSIGLQLSDLYDRPLEHCRPPSRSRIPAADILEVLAFEVNVATFIAYDILESRDIGELGWNRLAQACGRINSARTYCGGT
jgi:hypothetical protein